MNSEITRRGLLKGATTLLAAPVLARSMSTSAMAASNSLCAAPTSVSVESLDFDPKAEEMGELPGFQRSKICKGIILDD